MNVALTLSLTTLIGSLLLSRLVPPELHSYFRAAQILLVVGSLILGIRNATRARRVGEPWLDSLHRFLEYKGGQTLADYIIYEIRLLIGLGLFVVSPLQNYRLLMGSYFANEKIKAMLIAVFFILIAETGLIHLVIHNQLEGFPAIIWHLILIVSEFYICELLIGNLYYLKFSYVRVDERLQCKIGLLWMLDVPVASILSAEPCARAIGDRTPKLAVMNSDLTRIRFSSPVSLKRIFKTRVCDQIDIHLKQEDFIRLQARIRMESASL